MIVYLSQPFAGYDNKSSLLAQFKEILRKEGEQYIDPLNHSIEGLKDCEVVEMDRGFVQNCSIVVCDLTQPNLGGGVWGELYHAYERGIPIFVICPDEAWSSPWIRHHSTLRFKSGEVTAEELFQACKTLHCRVKIGFIGRMRTGKDTAAEYLRDIRGGDILKFADPLYSIMEFAQTVTGFPKEKDRKFLQWIGTDWARTKSPDVWINAFQRTLENFPSKNDIYVTDLRFENEVALLKKEGFSIVLVTAPQEALIERGASHETHISEEYAQVITDYDYHLHNDGSLQDFYSKVDTMLIDLTKR